MCLAVPGKIVEISGGVARVDFGGVSREAALDTLPDAAVGEYVLIHAGYAIARLDENEAVETIKLIREADALGG